MAEKTITEHVRSPQDSSEWLDIWTAIVQNDGQYVINPSNKWVYPSNQVDIEIRAGCLWFK